MLSVNQASLYQSSNWSGFVPLKGLISLNASVAIHVKIAHISAESDDDVVVPHERSRSEVYPYSIRGTPVMLIYTHCSYSICSSAAATIPVLSQPVAYTRKYSTSSRFLICERTPHFRPNRSRNKLIVPLRTRNVAKVLKKSSRSARTDFYSNTHVPGLAASTTRQHSCFQHPQMSMIVSCCSSRTSSR